MKRCFVTLIAVTLTTLSFSQKIPLINAGEMLDSAGRYHDAGDYQKSIEWLLKIPDRDTSHLLVLIKLAMSYQANKEYEKAIAACDEVLLVPSIHAKAALRNRGLALGRSGQYEKCIAFYEEQLKASPTDPGLLAGIALSHYEKKEYEKAVNAYFRLLKFYPYHPSAHYQLGNIARLMGRSTHAMLSYGLYFCVNASDNETLLQVNEYLDNPVVEAPVPGVGSNSAEKLDRIIRAKIAMDKNFKSDVPVKASVVKQFELLFDQIQSIQNDPADLWMRLYLPIYLKLKEKQMKLPFIYHILSSAKNDDVKKWANKNEKLTKAFYTEMNDALSSVRTEQTIPEFGMTSPVQAWYDDSNALQAVGTFKDGKRQGRWIFFDEHYNRSAEGIFKDDVKKGIWSYYYPEGTLKSTENYETGEIDMLNIYGSKREHFFLKDEKTEGEVKIYFRGGPLKEKLNYIADLRDGKGEAYFASGKLYQSYAYEQGKLIGPAIVYFENGKIRERMTYANDALDGKYESFHPNGAIEEEGTYKNGTRTGKWVSYYRNGKIERTGMYTDGGEPVGEWIYYDHTGTLSEKRNFDSDGRYQGDTHNYYGGKLHYTITYKKDLFAALEFFDANGKSVAKYGSSDGSFIAKYHFLTGEVESEGAYKKGKIDGVWKTYNRFKKIISVTEYKDGEMISRETYHPNGGKKSVTAYRNGKADGYYTGYYPNGEVETEGWYRDGEQEQQWLSYHENGKLSYDAFYVRGVPYGKQSSYRFDGTILSSTDFDYNYIVNITSHVGPGLSTGVRREGDAAIFETYFANKKLRSRQMILNGATTSQLAYFFPDGKLNYQYEYTSGRRNGQYVYFDPIQQKKVEGTFEEDRRQGRWNYYHANGRVSSSGNMLDNNQDSVWNYYYTDGKLFMESNFLNDERHGVTKYFLPDGTPVIELIYDNAVVIAYRDVLNSPQGAPIMFSGNGKIQVKFPNGVIAWADEYRDGERNGTFRMMQSNGRVIAEFERKNGRSNGSYAEYYADGKIEEKGTYKDGELEGLVEEFDENGTVVRSENYVSGILHGKCLYKKNGVTQEITFRYGFPEN